MCWIGERCKPFMFGAWLCLRLVKAGFAWYTSKNYGCEGEVLLGGLRFFLCVFFSGRDDDIMGLKIPVIAYARPRLRSNGQQVAHLPHTCEMRNLQARFTDNRIRYVLADSLCFDLRDRMQ